MRFAAIKWPIADSSLVCLSGLSFGCCENRAGATTNIKKLPFGKTPDGRAVYVFVLSNSKGVEAAITNYGGSLVSLKVPDRKGNLGDIVLGYSSVGGYVGDKAYFGALIGRYGNRIAHAKFPLNGT